MAKARGYEGKYAERPPSQMLNDTGPRIGGWSLLVLVSCTLAFPSVARAQEDVERAQEEVPALLAASDGSFLPQTISARIGSTGAFAYGSSGYDSSRHSPLVDSAFEVRVWGPFAIRAQTTYSNDTDKMRPSIAGRVQALRQEKNGIDGALTIFFKTEGFTETEGEIETCASLGRRFERMTVVGNVVYGQDPEGNERDGEIHAAVFHRRKWLIYGVDSRARFAIGTQHGHAATTEPVIDFLGGPVGIVAAGPISVFAQAGPSAFQLANSPARFGLAMLAGLGAAY
jgi:hypothetical protein